MSTNHRRRHSSAYSSAGTSALAAAGRRPSPVVSSTGERRLRMAGSALPADAPIADAPVSASGRAARKMPAPAPSVVLPGNVVVLFPDSRRHGFAGRRALLSRSAHEASGATSTSRRSTTLLGSEAGMATAEYAIATLAAVGFAGLLVFILRSDEVRGFLLTLIRTALALP